MDEQDFRLANLAESRWLQFFFIIHHLFLFPTSLSLAPYFLRPRRLPQFLTSIHLIPFISFLFSTSCSLVSAFLSLTVPASHSRSPPTLTSLLSLRLPMGRQTTRFHPLPRKQGPKFRAAVVDLAAGDGSTEGGPARDSNIVLNRRNFNLIRVRMSILGHGSTCKLGEQSRD